MGGDFNNILNYEERIGAPVNANELSEFRNCVGHCNLGDMKHRGFFYVEQQARRWR